MASTLKIPSSQTKVVSLCYYKVFVFILVVATHQYGYNPDLKTIVKKLFFISCCRLLADINNLS